MANEKSYISTKQLKKIKKLLPHGSVKKIASELDLDISTVSKVLNGKFQNQHVIDLSIKLIESIKEENLKMDKRINQL